MLHFCIGVIAVAADDAEADEVADVIGDTLNDVGLYEEFAEFVVVG